MRKANQEKSICTLSPIFKKHTCQQYISECMHGCKIIQIAHTGNSGYSWRGDQDQSEANGSKVTFALSVSVLETKKKIKKLKIILWAFLWKNRRGTIHHSLIHILMGLTYSWPTGSVPPKARISVLGLCTIHVCYPIQLLHVTSEHLQYG